MQTRGDTAKGTLNIEEAARRLGIARGSAYAAAKENRFPVPVIRIGRRVLVSRAAIEELVAGNREPLHHDAFE